MKSEKIFDQIIADMYEYLDEPNIFWSILKEANLGSYSRDEGLQDSGQDDYDVINKFLESFVEHVQYSDPEFYTYYPK